MIINSLPKKTLFDGRVRISDSVGCLADAVKYTAGTVSDTFGGVEYSFSADLKNSLSYSNFYRIQLCKTIYFHLVKYPPLSERNTVRHRTIQ